jgi:hypothetical protein
MTEGFEDLPKKRSVGKVKFSDMLIREVHA